MRASKRLIVYSWLLSLLMADPGVAATTQVVLFTGFGSGSGPNTGMGRLNTYLAAAGIPDYLGQVFEWTQHDAAFDWVELHAASRGTLVLVGHSFGGNSALQLADDYLSPLTVDLTIQIDPVKNFIAGANDILPDNVEVGFNYFQISTGFFEPQGEDFVSGATNINVEVLFNDTTITHTSIDDDSRLFTRIAANILANLNPESADFDNDGDVDGRDFLVWQRGDSPRSLSAGDLSLWQSQYGTAELNAQLVAVPEPGTLLLLAILPLVFTRSTSLRSRRG
jgi:pimeloyl-ACP methyl ester carboxylesterase